jgi:hypothetical protein
MIVGKFNLFSSGSGPSETDSVLSVRADRITSATVAAEFFQPVSGRRAQIVKFSRKMNITQFKLGASRCVGIHPSGGAFPELLRSFILE